MNIGIVASSSLNAQGAEMAWFVFPVIAVAIVIAFVRDRQKRKSLKLSKRSGASEDETGPSKE